MLLKTDSYDVWVEFLRMVKDSIPALANLAVSLYTLRRIHKNRQDIKSIRQCVEANGGECKLIELPLDKLR